MRLILLGIYARSKLILNNYFMELSIVQTQMDVWWLKNLTIFLFQFFLWNQKSAKEPKK